MPANLNLAYPGILKTIKSHLTEGRLESRAFLAWFLEHYYRLEDFQAQDAICDGPDDKGIDGIYVDNNLERIDVFQSKLLQNSSKTLGDSQLKGFIGTLTQIKSAKGIRHLQDSTGNKELKRLIQDEDIANKIERGFTVRGVFVTNAKRDTSADKYLAHQDNLVLFDQAELLSHYIPTGPTAALGAPITFDVYGYDYSKYKVGTSTVVFAPLSATDLVKLDGLANGELFAWNVRQSLGRTKVNKDIAKSIAEISDHKNFLLFHNGITILCGSLKHRDNKITISKYSVVNGCQSLTSLYDNRDKVSSELRIQTRLIHLEPHDPLVEKITHHSNNQNPINARDLQSNSGIQRRLQTEFLQRFGKKVFYKIKRGEELESASEVVENEDAARELLAFDLEQPWSCHQTYKLFDDLHADIFARPEVTADRIIVVHDAFSTVSEEMASIDDKLVSGYKLTKYFILYLLRQALNQDKKGREFVADPSKFLGVKPNRAKIKSALRAVIRDLIVDLNAEIRERSDSSNPFDHKRELKSPKAIRELSHSIIPIYQKAIARGRASSFGMEWSKK